MSINCPYYLRHWLLTAAGLVLLGTDGVATQPDDLATKYTSAGSLNLTEAEIARLEQAAQDGSGDAANRLAS